MNLTQLLGHNGNMVRSLARPVAVFATILGAPSLAHAESARAETTDSVNAQARRADTTRPHPIGVRLWLQPPLAGYTVFFGGSSDANANFGGASLALELSELVVVEAGVAVTLLPGGGEHPLSLGPDIWARAGLAPVLHRSHASGRGWTVQFASMLGYRHVERSRLVFEDYGIDIERNQAMALDVGPVATYRSKGGFGFGFRLLTGIIVPITQTHSWHGGLDTAAPHTHVAVPIGIDVGFAL